MELLILLVFVVIFYRAAARGLHPPYPYYDSHYTHLDEGGWNAEADVD